jgi:hypothetical protein
MVVEMEYFCFFFFFVRVGFELVELRALHLQSKHSWAISPVHFALVIYLFIHSFIYLFDGTGVWTHGLHAYRTGMLPLRPLL